MSFATNKQNSNSIRANTSVQSKLASQKTKNLKNQQANSKRMTMDYIVVEKNNKNNSKMVNNTSRNTQRLSVKMNRFSSSLAENENNVVIDMNRYDTESLNYLKRTISSTMKDKQNNPTKTNKLKSNLSPSSSESMLAMMPTTKTRNYIETSIQVTSNQQASMGSPKMQNEP